MKKVLLGTSALCAVALTVPAFAQSANEPIKLGLGAYFRVGYGGFVSQSGQNKQGRHDDAVKMDNVIYINGSTKLDNGITAGVSVQVRAENRSNSANNVQTTTFGAASTASGPDTIKRVYTYLRSDFGEFRIGDDDDARRQKAFGSPNATTSFGVNSPSVNFSNNPIGTNTTYSVIEQTSRTSRVLYFTPTIAGFNFAVSYAPDGSKANLNNGGQTDPDNNPGQVSNAVSLAGNYGGKFGAFSLDAYAGVSKGTRESVSTGSTSKNDPLDWSTGAVVGFGPFKFGGAYDEFKNARQPAAGASGGLDNATFDLGALYSIGPFSTSVNWTRGKYNGIVSTSPSSTATLDDIALQGAYAVGPGIQLEAQIEYSMYRSHASQAGAATNSSQNDYNGLGLMVGTGLKF